MWNKNIGGRGHQLHSCFQLSAHYFYTCLRSVGRPSLPQSLTLTEHLSTINWLPGTQLTQAIIVEQCLAWYNFMIQVLLAAVRDFVAANDELNPTTTFVWLDVLCVNQHATQHLTPEWWSSIFRDAIRAIGWTVTVLSPWDDPLPLTRAWCL